MSSVPQIRDVIEATMARAEAEAEAATRRADVRAAGIHDAEVRKRARLQAELQHELDTPLVVKP